MQNSTHSHKSFVQSFFVSDILANLGGNGVAFTPDGTDLVNIGNSAVTVLGATYQPGEVVLTPKQVGFFDQNLQATSSSLVDLDGLYIAQGRDDSNDTLIMDDRPMEISERIPADAKIKIHARGCELGRNTTYVIGDELGQAAAINLLDNTEYSLTISYRGSLVRRLHGRNFSVSRPSCLIDGTWAQLGLTTDAQKLSHIVEQLTYQTNKESHVFPALNAANNPIVAFAIGGAAATGTALSSIAVGDVLQLGVVTGTAQTITVKVDNAMFASIQDAIASGKVLAGEKIIAVDLANPSAAAEKIVIMALDRSLVDIDREPIMKYRLDIALGDGFAPNVAIDEVVRKKEDIGNPRQVQLQYEDYAELNKQFRVQPPAAKAFLYPSDVDLSKAYLLIDIEWLLEDESTISHGTSQPLFYTIAIPCCDANLVADFEGKLNDIFGRLSNVKLRGPHASAGRFNFGNIATACSADYAVPFKVI